MEGEQLGRKRRIRLILAQNSASTRYVEQVLRASWDKSISWQATMRQLGFPLIL
jgi:hypothetical protein